MHRFRFAAVTVLLFTAFSVDAEDQNPAPSPMVLVPRTEPLRLKFTWGETLYYALVEAGIDSMSETVDGASSTVSGDSLALMRNLAVLIVLPTGKLVATEANPDFNAEEVLTGEDTCHRNALAALGQLPSVPIKVGDTWEKCGLFGVSGKKITIRPLSSLRVSREHAAPPRPQPGITRVS